MLGNTITQVKNFSIRVNEGAGELSNSAQALSSGTTEQAGTIEEISSSMTEVASQTDQNNKNALQTYQVTGQALDITTNGNREMENMLSSINRIDETISSRSTRACYRYRLKIAAK